MTSRGRTTVVAAISLAVSMAASVLLLHRTEGLQRRRRSIRAGLEGAERKPLSKAPGCPDGRARLRLRNRAHALDRDLRIQQGIQYPPERNRTPALNPRR